MLRASGFPGTPEKGIGIAYMLGSTGGYTLPVSSSWLAIVGWAADRGFDRNPLKLFGVMLVARSRHVGDGLCLAGGADRRQKRRGASASPPFTYLT